MAPTLHGLMPILATPFDESGALDRAGLRRLVEFQLASGVDGVAVFGMASEGFALTTEERRTILDDVVRVVDGRIPVIAGVNGTSTATSIEQALLAEEGGADALMVLPPFMVKPPAATLVDFYGDVAAATSLSVMVQDAPGVTGVVMAPALIAEIARLDGVDSVKVEAPRRHPRSGPWSRRSMTPTSPCSADRTRSSAWRSTPGAPSARCPPASSPTCSARCSTGSWRGASTRPEPSSVVCSLSCSSVCRAASHGRCTRRFSSRAASSTTRRSATPRRASTPAAVRP